MISRPATSDYPTFFATYIDKVSDGDFLAQLAQQVETVTAYFGALTPAQAAYRYAPDKWSRKEMLGHLVDSERIFAYRALRFARNDPANLPGYDQNPYVENGGFADRTVQSLLDEFVPMRQSNIALFRSMDETMLGRAGQADGNAVTVRSLLYVMVGHVIHHQQVLTQRYPL